MKNHANGRIGYCSFLLFLTFFSMVVCSEGTATLSSPRIVTVCNRDQLELMCTTTESLLEWSLYLLPENSTIFKRYRQVIQSGGQTKLQTSRITVNSNMIFTVSRISGQNILPLMSELTLSPVTTSLNGTEINCTDMITSSTSSTVIHVISEDSVPAIPEVNINIQSEQPQDLGVIVNLELSQENLLYYYSYCNVSITPQIELRFEGSSRIQLTALYNTLYTVAVVGVHHCGWNDVTKTTELYYTKCSNPEAEVTNLIQVIGYTGLALEGTNITFSCPPGLLLTGCGMATCKHNGLWEPDPSEASYCVGSQLVTDGMGIDMLKTTVVSSLSTFVLTTLFFIIIIGCVCGYQKCKKKSKTYTVYSINPIAIYEDVIPRLAHCSVRQQEASLKLESNAAYTSSPFN